MSAYVVSSDHIRYLIQAARSERIRRGDGAFRWYHGNGWKELDHRNEAEVGQMLWDECIASVHARYPHDTRETLPGEIEDGERFVYEHRFEKEYKAGRNLECLLAKIEAERRDMDTSDWGAP